MVAPYENELLGLQTEFNLFTNTDRELDFPEAKFLKTLFLAEQDESFRF
jgi:hypothetical protein